MWAEWRWIPEAVTVAALSYGVGWLIAKVRGLEKRIELLELDQ